MTVYKIKESSNEISNFPPCVCVYQNDYKKFSMIEVNTGYYKGSIKMISKIYNSYDELQKNFNTLSTVYPILHNYVIYNDVSYTL